MWVFSEIMGLPVDDRRLLIELGDKLLGNTDPEVVGEENVARPGGDRPVDPAAAVLEPVRGRPDRVRLPARRGAADRAARRRHDEARRGRDRRLAPLRARVRPVLHPAHDGRQRDDAAHDQPRPDRPAREPRGDARGSSPTRPSPGTAADEILRRAHPVHHFRRTASRDIDGARAPDQGRRQGDALVRVRQLRRGASSPIRTASTSAAQPNRHLTFGLGGPHFCLGAHLAKLEVKIWLEEMIPYLDRIELAGPPTRLRSNFFNGIKRLPVQVRS